MTPITLTLPGSIRSKKNSKQVVMVGGKNCPRRPMILPSKAYKEWEDQARRVAWLDAVVPPLSGPIHIEAHFYCKGTLPDLSGACESIADCLEGIIYQNDKQIYSWDGSRVHHDLLNPRTEVTIRHETGYDAGELPL